jgi:hypothetical protein
MPVKQLATPCWYARYDGGEEYQNDIHYDTSPQAHKAAKEIGGGDEPGQTPAVEVGEMDAPCWTARCDGPGCDAPLEDGEMEWVLHLETRAEIEAVATEYGWIVTKDGTVLCDGCAPGCEDADLAVTQQVPGQGELPGEEASDAQD